MLALGVTNGSYGIVKDRGSSLALGVTNKRDSSLALGVTNGSYGIV